MFIFLQKNERTDLINEDAIYNYENTTRMTDEQSACKINLYIFKTCKENCQHIRIIV